MSPKFGALEGKPVRFVDDEAWVFSQGVWSQANTAEVRTGAHVMTEAEYKNDFGHLPPLPKSAFQSGPS
jgi:hypothetical protein